MSILGCSVICHFSSHCACELWICQSNKVFSIPGCVGGEYWRGIFGQERNIDQSCSRMEYRPVSDVPFLSKMIPSIPGWSNCSDSFQSWFRPGYIETALVTLVDDLCWEAEKGSTTPLDLPVAFDTTECCPSRLSIWIGIWRHCSGLVLVLPEE